MRSDVEFIPVIVTDRHEPLADGITPGLVRIAPASRLTDGDLVVGAAENVTYASLRAYCANPTATIVLGGAFYREPYSVEGHTIAPSGWVALASGAFGWRSDDWVLYIPRDHR
ncbi:hypothetical protein [Streptomyces sp. NPDC001536]|uniref:hypothetical protein n=1 Tax=Streptomyces sp. NPDC001536 TaxID=3364583 RepID=UPI0036AC51C1